MRIGTIFAAALLSTTLLSAGPVLAKSLVYCSEGSPENFNPQINTTGTSLDAARPVYNQLGRIRAGHRPTWCPVWPKAGRFPMTARQ